MNQNENRFIGWDDREAEEDRAALERWYRRTTVREQRRTLAKRWGIVILTLAVDVALVIVVMRWIRVHL